MKGQVKMSEGKKKYLTARQYLEQLQELDTNINQDLERLDEMKINATCTGGIDYSKERVQTSTSGDKLCNDVTRYISLDEEINAEIDRFTDAKNQIISEIRGLHVNNYIKLLYKVYVQYKSIHQASKEMRLSYSYVIELHKKALAAFEETYKNLYYLT